MTSVTMIYGMQHIDATATVILLQTEPVYSLILSTVVIGERPSSRQLLATATILIGIGSVFFAGNAFSPMLAAMMLFITRFLADLARARPARDAAADADQHSRRALHFAPASSFRYFYCARTPPSRSFATRAC